MGKRGKRSKASTKPLWAFTEMEPKRVQDFRPEGGHVYVYEYEDDDKDGKFV